MKFLLVGHGGFYNRGCEAIVLTTIDMIRKNFHNPSFILSSFDAENDRKYDLGDAVKIIDHHFIVKRFTPEWGARQFKKVISSNYRSNYWKAIYAPILKEINDVDCVISVGGDNYTMDYGYPDYFLNLNRIVKEAGKKLVIWGASVGPFQEDENLDTIINNLSSVDLITARESYTVNYLEGLGIKNNVRRVADPAFLLAPDSSKSLDRYLSSSKDILGFNISPLLKKYHSEAWEQNVISDVVSFLESIISDYKMKVLLIPHVTGRKDSQNDYVYMKNICDKIGDKANIDIIPAEYNARQMKYAISKCRYFIGARTHSTIAALSSEIPTLSIGYSIKARGINEDIFGGLDYIIESSKLSLQILREKFDMLKCRESEIRMRLKMEIPMLKKKAMDNSVFLKDIVKLEEPICQK